MNTDTLERTDLRTAPAQPYPRQVSDSPPPDPVVPPASYQEVKQVAGEQVHKVASDIKETGIDALETAKEVGNDFVHEQKEKIAAKIDSYVEAVRAACDSMAQGENNLLLSPAQGASRQLERASDYLRNHDTLDFLHDLGDLARRKPEIVFGSLFVIGLASVRFLKASSRERRSSQRIGAPAGRLAAPYSPPSGQAGYYGSPPAAFEARESFDDPAALPFTSNPTTPIQ